MVNILLAVRLFQIKCSGPKVLIRCDNKTVVSVLTQHFGAWERNIWCVSVITDTDLHYAHVRGLDNDLLTCSLVGREVKKISVNYCQKYRILCGSQLMLTHWTLIGSCNALL